MTLYQMANIILPDYCFLDNCPVIRADCYFFHDNKRELCLSQIAACGNFYIFRYFAIKTIIGGPGIFMRKEKYLSRLE